MQEPTNTHPARLESNLHQLDDIDELRFHFRPLGVIEQQKRKHAAAEEQSLSPRRLRVGRGLSPQSRGEVPEIPAHAIRLRVAIRTALEFVEGLDVVLDLGGECLYGHRIGTVQRKTPFEARCDS